MRSFWEATGSNPDFFGLTHVTFKEHNIFLKHIKHSFWKTWQTLIHCHEPQSNCKTLNLGLFSPVLPFFPPNVVEQCFFFISWSVCPMLRPIFGRKEGKSSTDYSTRADQWYHWPKLYRFVTPRRLCRINDHDDAQITIHWVYLHQFLSLHDLCVVAGMIRGRFVL